MSNIIGEGSSALHMINYLTFKNDCPLKLASQLNTLVRVTLSYFDLARFSTQSFLPLIPIKAKAYLYSRRHISLEPISAKNL